MWVNELIFNIKSYDTGIHADNYLLFMQKKMIKNLDYNIEGRC